MATAKERAEIELVINNKVAKNSLKELRLELIEESRILDKMKKDDDPAGWQKQAEKVGILRMAVKQANDEINAAAGSLKKLSFSWKDIAGGLVGGNIAMQAIDKITAAIPALIGKAGELSDALADVSKQTGLTGGRLEYLDNELKKIETRTSVEELRNLASVAGKLGYDTAEDILAFVRAADMINVALGEDLGGNIEEVTNDIGKLVEIFDMKDEYGIEKAMLMIASGINTLGASSAANEGYLVAWSKRFAGIAPNAGISIADTLGMAATMDILGQSSEMSATNIGKMIIALGKDVPYFAKVAKMSVTEFSNLLKTDGNEAFIRVLEGARNTTKGVEGLANMLKTLGIDGSEGAAVIGALVNKLDLLREQQDIANKSVSEGVSVQEEFNIKNNNSAAILEKISKVLSNLVERAASKFEPVIRVFGKWFGVVNDLDEKISDLKKSQEDLGKAETNLPKLISKYEELRIKSVLTKDEQAELKRVVKEIADMVPGAVTQFDKYGNAMWINTDIAKNYLKVLRDIFNTKQGDTSDALKKEADLLEKRAAALQKLLNAGKMRNDSDRIGGGGLGGGSLGGGFGVVTALSDSQIKKYSAELAGVQKKLAEVKKQEAQLSGGTKSNSDKIAPPPKKDPPGENDNSDLNGPDKNKAKYNNDFILKNQQQLTLALMEEQQKELQAAQYKYDEMRERAKGHAKDIATINEQQVQEIQQINDKYNKKYLGDFDKTIRGQLKFLNNQSKEENEYQQKRADDRAKRADKELFEINDHYQKEIAQAKAKGESIVELEKEWRSEVAKLNADRGQKDTDDFLRNIFDSYRSDMAMAQETGANKEDIIKAHLERLRALREKYGTMDVEQQKKVNQEIARTDRDLLAIRISNIEKLGETLKLGGQVMNDVLSLAASNQNEYAEFQKAIALFQIAVESGLAVAKAITVSTPGDPWSTALRIATAVAAVTSGMLKAKQMMSEAHQPSTPAFRYHGGPTDIGSIYKDTSGNPEGWVTRPTLFDLGPRSYIAGEGHKAEYVLSSAMLKDPAIADFVGGVEALRQQRYFENGGSTALAAPRTTGVTANPNARMERLLEALLEKDGGWNYSVFEKYEEHINDVRSRASA